MESTMTFRGTGGESNSVSTRETAEGLEVHDVGADLGAGEGCLQVDASRAVCVDPADVTFRRRVFTLGHGDDRLDVTASDQASMSTYIEARGGPGNDAISTGTGYKLPRRRTGRRQPPRRAGGRLADGRSRQRRPGRRPRSRCGWLLPRARPGRRSLRTGSARQGDDLDRLLDIEDFSGGPGPDVIEGDDASNVLSGGGEDDRLAGLEGADTLQADEVDLRGDDISADGPGEDDLLGGPGNDTLESKSGCDTYDGGPGDDFLILSIACSDEKGLRARRPITCGTGRDRVDGPDLRDVLEACERANLGSALYPSFAVAPGRLTRGWRARVTLPCDAG